MPSGRRAELPEDRQGGLPVLQQGERGLHDLALGPPDDPAAQREIHTAALELLGDYRGPLPVLKESRLRP